MIPQEKNNKKNHSYIKEYLINDGKISNISKNSINVISLFSGCGGLNEGFKDAGFKTTISNDIWEPAGKTFIRNNKNSKFILGDITQKKIRDEIIKYGKGSDVLVGGPPCQAYSMAGARDVDDPRGKLFEDYVKIVKAIKPKYFVMENVKGLMSMEHDKTRLSKNDQKKLDKIKKLESKKNELLLKRKQSKNTPKIKFTKAEESQLEEIKQKLKEERKLTSSLRVKVTETIKKRFLSLGYDVQIKVLNAADFGVPQKRQRVIVIGGLDGYPVRFPEETYKEKSNGKNLELFKSNLLDWVTVKQAIDDLKNKPENIPFNHIFNKCGKDFQRRKAHRGFFLWVLCLCLRTCGISRAHTYAVLSSSSSAGTGHSTECTGSESWYLLVVVVFVFSAPPRRGGFI